MKAKKGYEFLEHTADVYVAAYGRNLNEAFANAAKAVFDVMTDVRKVAPKTSINIEVRGEDLEALLYSWLEQFLIIFDTQQLLFSEFEVNITQEKDGTYLLRGIAKGEKYDPSKHPSETEVKAITYSLMEIKEDKGFAVVKFVLDI